MTSHDRGSNATGAPDKPTRGSGLKSLLSNRYFRRMWAVTSVSSLGDWVGVFALTFYVQELTDSSEFAVGGVLLFRVVPAMFMGPFAGVLADRFDRRRLMVTADVCRALLIASIPWIHNLWGLYVLSAALELLHLVWAPAKDATVPNLVGRDELLVANQLSIISTYATFPLGGAVVTLLAIPAAYLSKFDLFSLLRDQPIGLAFFFDGATFLFSAIMVATFPREKMRAKRATTTEGGWSALRDLIEGFRFVSKDPMIRTTVMGAWIAFTGGSAIVSLGPILADRLTSSEAAAQAAWGALIIVVGVGLVSGMAVAGLLARYVKRERLFPAGLMASGIATVGAASTTTLQPALPAVVGVGLGAGLAWVTAFTMIQLRTDDRLRGRTFATLQTGIQLSLFLGLAGWPLIAGSIGDRRLAIGRYVLDVAGTRLVLWAGGGVLFLAGLLSARALHDRRSKRRAARVGGLRLSPSPSGGSRGGLFIAFEGVEGAGKSTQMKLLYEWLRGQGREVIVTREPGGTPIAERIRHIVLDPTLKGMDAKAEALLYAASRAQHVAETVGPALERGAVVLCDRYIDSSLAYQGYARGLGEDDVLRLSMWATDELLPDLVVLLHVDPGIGLGRTQGDPDRMEQEDLAFHQHVADAYLQLARAYPSRFAVVNASASIEQVQEQIKTAILPFLQLDPVP